MIDQHVSTRPRRGHADLHALQILCPRVPGCLVCADAEFQPRIHALQHERLYFLREGLHHDGVFVRAGDDVGAMADQRLQRLRAAGEIVDLHVEAFVPEIAQAIGKGERKVIKCRLAAHGQHDFRFLGNGGCGGSTEREREAQRGQQAAHDRSRGVREKFHAFTEPFMGKARYPFRGTDHWSPPHQTAPALCSSSASACAKRRYPAAFG